MIWLVSTLYILDLTFHQHDTALGSLSLRRDILLRWQGLLARIPGGRLVDALDMRGMREDNGLLLELVQELLLLQNWF